MHKIVFLIHIITTILIEHVINLPPVAFLSVHRQFAFHLSPHESTGAKIILNPVTAYKFIRTLLIDFRYYDTLSTVHIFSIFVYIVYPQVSVASVVVILLVKMKQKSIFLIRRRIVSNVITHTDKQMLYIYVGIRSRTVWKVIDMSVASIY